MESAAEAVPVNELQVNEELGTQVSSRKTTAQQSRMQLGMKEKKKGGKTLKFEAQSRC